MGMAARRLRVGACLSLTGRYARFGLQAARALETWGAIDGGTEVVVEDDTSAAAGVVTALDRLAGCDLLLGPYSTGLMRAAGPVAADTGRLLWNHGGAGDDVQSAWPGCVLSVLTPASRYARPFLHALADEPARAPVWVAEGRGSFGRQVAVGAERGARALGLEAVRVPPGDPFPHPAEGGWGREPPVWDLFCAGSFEEDVATIQRARRLSCPPRRICAVAAGVREFGRALANPEGVEGVAQWVPGAGSPAEVGPGEADFVARYSRSAGALPDYPAVQAAAAAALAAHCARLAGGCSRDLLWPAAATLDAATLFGRFKVHPVTGAQAEHDVVLVRWTTGGPERDSTAAFRE